MPRVRGAAPTPAGPAGLGSPMSDLPRDCLQASLGMAYVVERELGGGGMSRVFLAEETRFRRRVVVKLLPRELVGALSAERFERETATAARLQHPHIVPVLGAGEADGLPYFTMPFVDGETSRARLARGRPELREALAVLRDVAKGLAHALAYAHARRGAPRRQVGEHPGCCGVADAPGRRALPSVPRRAWGGLTGGRRPSIRGVPRDRHTASATRGECRVVSGRTRAGGRTCRCDVARVHALRCHAQISRRAGSERQRVGRRCAI
jgi:hypothetical protein